VDVVRAVAGLPRRQREAIVLRYFADLDTRALAKAMRTNENAAKALLLRARRALAEALGTRDPEEATEHARP
jgi:DNA-directed RNA polymerase specialized sigma24 family protein